MLKVVLQYTDCLQDGKNVFSVLASDNIMILKTKSSSYSTKTKITILIDNYDELNKVIHDLNKTCLYEVRVVKVKNIGK